MLIRVVSGVVGAAVLLGLLMLPQPIPPILVILAGLFAAYEFIVLTRAKWGFVVGGLLLSALLLAIPSIRTVLLNRDFYTPLTNFLINLTESAPLVLLLMQLAAAIIFIEGVRRGRPTSLSWTALFGLPLLIAWPFSLLADFAGVSERWPVGAGLLVVVLALAWAADTGAFACGKLFGKRKLILRVSPGKTWEGYFGGCFAVAAIVFALSLTTRTGLPQPEMTPFVFNGASVGGVVVSLVLGFILGTAALVGDLAFSAIKRARGVKESGTFLPGHGGILDRIDGLLVLTCWASLLSSVLANFVV